MDADERGYDGSEICNEDKRGVGVWSPVGELPRARRPRHGFIVGLICLLAANVLHAESKIVVETPDIKIISAESKSTSTQKAHPGQVEKSQVTFDKLLPNQSYDLSFKLPDNHLVQFLDLSWYNGDKPAAPPEAMSDEDRQAITEIVTNIKAFTNKNNVMQLLGDSQHAAAIVDLVRDTDFHAGAGEIIWRVEVWYFENQAGGWAKVQQQNRVIDRDRYKNRADYEKARAGRRYVGLNEGLRTGKDSTTTIKWPADAATSPASERGSSPATKPAH